MTTNNQIYRYDIFSRFVRAFMYYLRQRDCFKIQNRSTNSRGSCLLMLDIASFLRGFSVAGRLEGSSKAKSTCCSMEPPDLSV